MPLEATLDASAADDCWMSGGGSGVLTGRGGTDHASDIDQSCKAERARRAGSGRAGASAVCARVGSFGEATDALASAGDRVLGVPRLSGSAFVFAVRVFGGDAGFGTAGLGAARSSAVATGLAPAALSGVDSGVFLAARFFCGGRSFCATGPFFAVDVFFAGDAVLVFEVFGASDVLLAADAFLALTGVVPGASAGFFLVDVVGSPSERRLRGDAVAGFVSGEALAAFDLAVPLGAGRAAPAFAEVEAFEGVTAFVLFEPVVVFADARLRCLETGSAGVSDAGEGSRPVDSRRGLSLLSPGCRFTCIALYLLALSRL
jgi:hypothetical protein